MPVDCAQRTEPPFSTGDAPSTPDAVPAGTPEAEPEWAVPVSEGTGERPAAALLDRDHSILAFNERVLDWAVRPDVPLFERLRYLCIVSSNLDEFFEVRAAPHLAAATQRRHQGGVHCVLVRSHLGQGARPGEPPVRALQRRADAGLRGAGHPHRFARRAQRGAAPLGAGLFRARSAPSADAGGARSGASVSAGGQQVAQLHRAPRGQRRLRARERDRHRASVPRVLAAPDPHARQRRRAEGRCSSACRAWCAHTWRSLFPGSARSREFSQFRVTRHSDLAVDEEDVRNLRTALRQGLQQRHYGAGRAAGGLVRLFPVACRTSCWRSSTCRPARCTACTGRSTWCA